MDTLPKLTAKEAQEFKSRLELVDSTKKSNKQRESEIAKSIFDKLSTYFQFIQHSYYGEEATLTERFLRRSDPATGETVVLNPYYHIQAKFKRKEVLRASYTKTRFFFFKKKMPAEWVDVVDYVDVLSVSENSIQLNSEGEKCLAVLPSFFDELKESIDKSILKKEKEAIELTRSVDEIEAFTKLMNWT